LLLSFLTAVNGDTTLVTAMKVFAYDPEEMRDVHQILGEVKWPDGKPLYITRWADTYEPPKNLPAN
jgi:hypothetical protein